MLLEGSSVGAFSMLLQGATLRSSKATHGVMGNASSLISFVLGARCDHFDPLNQCLRMGLRMLLARLCVGASILIRAFSKRCPVSMLVLAPRYKLVAYSGAPW